jgi:hypothetical protein
MCGALLDLPAIAHALGFAPVAMSMIIATPQFRAAASRVEPHHENSSAASDPLADELKRPQLTAGQAKEEAAWEVSFAENRCRFFADVPATAAQPTASGR